MQTVRSFAAESPSTPPTYSLSVLGTRVSASCTRVLKTCVLRPHVLKLHRSSCLKASGKMHIWEPAKCIFAGASDNALPKASSGQYIGTIAMSAPPKQCSRPSGNRTCMGPATASLQAPRTTHRPKLPRNSRNYRELTSILVLLRTVRKHENAFFRRLQNAFLHALKDTHCSHKMHFATTPERILCADNDPKTN